MLKWWRGRLAFGWDFVDKNSILDHYICSVILPEQVRLVREQRLPVLVSWWIAAHKAAFKVELVVAFCVFGFPRPVALVVGRIAQGERAHDVSLEERKVAEFFDVPLEVVLEFWGRLGMANNRHRDFEGTQARQPLCHEIVVALYQVFAGSRRGSQHAFQQRDDVLV